jgi:choline dehydrogenase
VNTAFLQPARARSNLAVVTGAHVIRIDVEGRLATGVTYEANGQRQQIRAVREVILSAGAYGSPQLLMLSGIGDPAELAAHAIALKHALPGVGRNLLDHPDACVLTTSRDHGGVGLGPRGAARMAGAIVKYARRGEGLLRASVTEMGGFLRTSPECDVPDIQFHGVPVLFDDSGRDLSLLARHGYSLHVCVLRPKSKGRVTLASADPYAEPVIDKRALTHPDDVRSLVAGIRIGRKWLAASALAPYRKREIVPGPSAQSDAEIEQACAIIWVSSITLWAPARWATTTWRWSNPSSRCTASMACASSMRRSCRR